MHVLKFLVGWVCIATQQEVSERMYVCTALYAARIRQQRRLLLLPRLRLSISLVIDRLVFFCGYDKRSC